MQRARVGKEQAVYVHAGRIDRHAVAGQSHQRFNKGRAASGAVARLSGQTGYQTALVLSGTEKHGLTPLCWRYRQHQVDSAGHGGVLKA